jgi:hypothetical protein
VTVQIEHPDQPRIYVEVWDTDPKSPTYYDPALPAFSTFGPVPYGFSTPGIQTVPQAQVAAAAQLRKVKGFVESVSVTTVGHPGHEVGDRVRVQQSRSRIAGTYMVDRVKVPLRSGPLELRMRAQDLGS